MWAQVYSVMFFWAMKATQKTAIVVTTAAISQYQGNSNIKKAGLEWFDRGFTVWMIHFD